MIGLARAFGKILDLLILDDNLAAQELILSFESPDIPIICRGLSPVVAARLRRLQNLVLLIFSGDIVCRGMPRQVATCRDRSHLLNVCNMLHDRRRVDEKLLSER